MTSKVTILTTIKNMSGTVGRFLDSLLSQEFDQPYDIVVIDSLSDDGTMEILADYAKKHKKIKVIEYQCTQPQAFNYALDNKLVTGDIVALIDADCVAEKDWLKRIVANIESGKEIVGGIGLTPLESKGLQKVIGFDLDYRFLSAKKGVVKRHPNMNLANEKRNF